MIRRLLRWLLHPLAVSRARFEEQVMAAFAAHERALAAYEDEDPPERSWSS